jgi:hypothetical protein
MYHISIVSPGDPELPFYNSQESDYVQQCPPDAGVVVVHNHDQEFGVVHTIMKVVWQHSHALLGLELVPMGCRYWPFPLDLELMGQIEELVQDYWNFSLTLVVLVWCQMEKLSPKLAMKMIDITNNLSLYLLLQQ